LSAYGYSYDILGDDSNNNIAAGNGNDTLDGGAGADVIAGGAGHDTYVIDNTVVREESGAEFGTDLIKASVTYTLSANVENLELTGTDNLNGTGNGLANNITGNSGNNRLNGGEGADSMSGGAGNDTYVVDNTGDVITEAFNAGTDTVEASVNHALRDNVENLTLTGTDNLNGTGNTLANTLTGNSGNNTLDGGAGADTMIGGAGNDTYIVDNTGDVVREESGAEFGTDLIKASVTYTLSANVENLELTGTDNLNGTGNTLNNTLTGNSGNNRLNGGGGADSMSGGAGNDTYVVDNTGDVITEALNAGTDSVEASVNHALSDNVENLTLTGPTALNGTGNSLDNIILGNSADNILAGGGGDDTLNGGAGIDTASFVGTTAAVIASLGLNGLNGSAAGDGNDVLISIENLLGGNGNDTFNGNEQANRLDGAAGADSLNGGAGSDTLVGGDGNDQLNGEEDDDLIFGGAGSDTINGGNGIDTASYSGSDAGVTINLGTGTASGGHAQADVLSNIENLIGSSSHGDTLTGNSGVNRIEGGGGNDTLNGGGGADTLVGGADNDTYVIHNAGVTIIETANQGTDLVQSSIDFTLGEHLENLQLMGTANLNGTGNTVNNTITGNAGDNLLDGGVGNDTLIGGAGNDSLIGGTGEDSLQGGAGNDTLIGGIGDDTLDLRTDNPTLVGDWAEGGDGTDNVNINQSALGGSVVNLDGGAGTDTLRVFGSAGAQLDLKALNAKNFETLDLRSDTETNKVLISSEGIMKLVNNTSAADVLTLRMGKNDSYTIATETNISVTQGEIIGFYNNANTLIAQVNFEYA
jgi:Ca2+-binding RTX toxin-like protein